MDLPEGYYVKEEYVDGGYIYTVTKEETIEDFDWCNDSGYSDVFDETAADLDAQDSKWGKYKI